MTDELVPPTQPTDQRAPEEQVGCVNSCKIRYAPSEPHGEEEGKRPASSMVMVDRGEIFSKGKMATK